MPASLPIKFPRYMISASRHADCHVRLDRTDHLNVAQVCTQARMTVCQISAAAAAHLEKVLKLLLNLCQRADTAPTSLPSQHSMAWEASRKADLPPPWEAKLTCKTTPKRHWGRKSCSVPQKERSAGCRGEHPPPDDWGIWKRESSSEAQGRAWQYKKKNKPRKEFDIKAATKGNSGRIAAATLCADSVPAKPHVSCRSHLT